MRLLSPEQRTRQIWHGIKSRCNDPRNIGYHRYGGRGISLCKRWNKFANFLKDLGVCPPGKQIDRIDNSSNYTPRNCRWVTAKENSRNKSSNRFLTHNNKTKTLSAWAEVTGINLTTIFYRFKAGHSPDRILSPGRLKRIKSSHCSRGHIFDGTNTILRSNGYRACRLCRKRSHKNHKKGKNV